MIDKFLSIALIAILDLLSVAQNSSAQESFFSGKTIRIVVATSAGGVNSTQV